MMAVTDWQQHSVRGFLTGVVRKRLGLNLVSDQTDKGPVYRIKDGKAPAVAAVRIQQALGKPQSFIAKYEGGERRIDLIEFIAIARALDADPVKLFRDFVAGRRGPKGQRKTPIK